MPPEVPPAALRLAIDADALAANWQAMDRLSGSARAGAAIKADAYGLGASRVAKVLRRAGCENFFVAHWGEAAELRADLAPWSVSVLHGPLTAADAQYSKAIGFKPVINSVVQARLWLDAGGGPCDLMVDTGINRLGLPLDALSDPAIAMLEVDVLISHLASADEDCALNRRQQERWMAARQAISHQRASLANSAGIALGQDYHGDLTRPGLALYGGIPRSELADAIRQVATPQAALIQVRDLQAGESIGYNATFVADGPMRVGVISLGYADGYLRCWSGKGTMRFEGKALPVLGRVSMDMTVVDLTAAPSLREGDWVSVDYSLPQAARISGLSQYELLTVLGRRFPR